MVYLPNNPGRERRIAYGNYVRSGTLVNSNSNQTRSTPNLSVTNIRTFSNILSDGSLRNNWINPYSIKGLTLDQISKCSEVYVKENSECCICYQDDKNIVRKLKCGHEFHLDCIDQWLCNKKICPMCRTYLA